MWFVLSIEYGNLSTDLPSKDPTKYVSTPLNVKYFGHQGATDLTKVLAYKNGCLVFAIGVELLWGLAICQNKACTKTFW